MSTAWLFRTGILLAAPAVLYWQYTDVKKVFSELERVHEDQQRLYDNQVQIVKQQAQIVNELKEIQAPRAPRIETPISVPAPSVQPLKPLSIVKTNQKVPYNSNDLFCMAKNIYHEAAHEPIIGRYAVAQVTLNRKTDPKYPKRICEVILDPFQFSWANDKKIHWVQPKGPAWEESKRIAHDVIINGYRVQGLEKGLFYHADYVSPKWRDNNAKITQIGRHIFYSKAL